MVNGFYSQICVIGIATSVPQVLKELEARSKQEHSSSANGCLESRSGKSYPTVSGSDLLSDLFQEHHVCLEVSGDKIILDTRV